MAVVLALTATFTVVEVVGGLLTGSLALLADAGHMLSDNLSLGLALFAAWLAGRPATPERSFGYQRAEILAALFNGMTLVAISIWIFVEAYSRLREPPEILGGWMLVVAALGLVVNVAGALILSRSDGENLNVEGALRHVIADALGSVGAIVAALVIVLTGWRYADPLVSVAIGLLILASSWSLVRDSTNILLEATPRGIDAKEVGRAMANAEGVVEIHDLHIWTITSGFPALSAHVLVGQSEDCHARRRDLEQLLADEYGVSHTTLQVDHVGDHEGQRHGSRFLPLGEKPDNRALH
jgi:cobalt-zinc-cadmium efflux system protein